MPSKCLSYSRLRPFSYYTFDGDEVPVIPFHDECYKILYRVIEDSSGGRKIDHDVLFTICSSLCEDYATRLKLDYGQPEPPNEQFWESNRGQEVLEIVLLFSLYTNRWSGLGGKSFQ